MAGQLGSYAVGSTVKIQINGVLKDFIIVHQGLPSSIYDSSCNGTWVMQKEVDSRQSWNKYSSSGYNNAYAGSNIEQYAQNTYYNTIEAEVRSAIKNVKIPYVAGNGYAATMTGASGLSARIFSLSAEEIGAESSSSKTRGDGSLLSYFEDGNTASAKAKRVAAYSGSAIYWWTRSPAYNQNTYGWAVDTSGETDATYGVTQPYGFRPAFVLPTNMYVDDSGHVIVNSPPSISGSNGNLGSFGENIPSYHYTVTDAQGGTVSVTEKLDGTTIRTYNVSLGNQNTLTFTADAWRKVLNGSHTLTITARDPQGLTDTRTQTFTKNVTSCSVVTTAAFAADAMPDRCVVHVQGSFPNGSSLKVEVCNNGNDASPTWENITSQALNSQKYFFTNKNKTAASWGVKVRVTLSRGTASGACYITSIGGNFQ